MSERAVVLAIGLALLLVLAGCQSADRGPVTGTTEANVTPTPANLDGATVRRRHQEALASAGSFNATREVSLEANTSNVSALFSTFGVTTEYAVDATEDRALSETTVLGSVVTYTEGDETYRRRALGEDTSRENATFAYDDGAGNRTLDPVDRTQAYGRHSFLFENASYLDLGTTSYDGVEVTRYEAHGLDAIDGLGETAFAGTRVNESLVEGSNVTLDGFDAVLLVDADGVVRYSQWSVTVRNSRTNATFTFSVTYTVSDVGSATVPRPDWLSYAKNQSEANGAVAVPGRQIRPRFDVSHYRIPSKVPRVTV